MRPSRSPTSSGWRWAAAAWTAGSASRPRRSRPVSSAGSSVAWTTRRRCRRSRRPRPSVARSGDRAYRQSMAHVAAGLAHLLNRPELRALFLSALGGGSVLVGADAGFGKTTALRDALPHAPRRAAWVRCGDAGGDAGRLLDLVIEAIRGAPPGAVDVLAERLTVAREPVDPERAAAGLARELERLLVDPFVICLDDAEA